MQIIDLLPDNQNYIEQIAEILVEAFRENWPETWPELTDALGEVHDSFAPDRISRVAVGEANQVLGWIGGIKEYDGKVWELHPLVVKPACQGQGIGRALVTDFEQQIKIRGGLTIWLGSDDENNQTSLSNVNLYFNLWQHIQNIQNLRKHPFEFYQKLGYVITGVCPDANGIGKPDIFMAKRV